MIPKGKLLLIGGHEEKGETGTLVLQRKKEPRSHFEILGSLISKIPRAHHYIEIIAAASSIPAEMEQLYIDSYKKAGFTQVGVICIASRADTDDPVLIKRLQGSHAAFFTGGDQQKLVTTLADTAMLKAIHNKYHHDPHFILGGTSAGAMAIPETIIVGGITREALYQGGVDLASGLDLIQQVIVDTHFIKRGRFGRLAHAVLLHPDCLGIGLEEDTAIIISDGNCAECIGSGMAILIDGKHLGTTNIDTVDATTAIVAENLRVSILAEGCRYLLKERKLIAMGKGFLQGSEGIV